MLLIICLSSNVFLSSMKAFKFGQVLDILVADFENKYKVYMTGVVSFLFQLVWATV
jgi:hypothetical protein